MVVISIPSRYFDLNKAREINMKTTKSGMLFWNACASIGAPTTVIGRLGRKVEIEKYTNEEELTDNERDALLEVLREDYVEIRRAILRNS